MLLFIFCFLWDFSYEVTQFDVLIMLMENQGFTIVQVQYPCSFTTNNMVELWLLQ